MNAREIGAVLAKCAAYDRRKVGEADILAWHEALGDLDLDEALAAVTRHYRTSHDWLMPDRIRDLVRSFGRRRTPVAAPRALPSRYDPEANGDDARERGRRAYEMCLAAIRPRRPEPADQASTAMDALRAATTAPSWPDPEEVSRHALAQ